MAVRKRTTSTGKVRYDAIWRDPDGKQKSKAFDRKIDADRHMTKMTHDKLTGGYVDPAAGRRLFRDYAEDWRKAQVHRGSTAANTASALKNHILPAFGDRPIGSIRRGEIKAWVKDRSLVLAPSSLQTTFTKLAAIFNSAVDDQVIAKSPAKDIKLPTVAPHLIIPLPPAEVDRMIRTVAPEHRALFVLGAGLGLRRSEALGLTVDRINFLAKSGLGRGKVRIDRQIQGGKFAPLKTTSSYREIPLPKVVAEILAEHIANYLPVDPRQPGLLFDIRTSRAFGEIWQSAAPPEGYTFHDLRHYYASLLIHHGESVKVVQARLGHKTAKETLDTYAHLWPDSEDGTRAAVDEVLLAETDDEQEEAE